MFSDTQNFAKGLHVFILVYLDMFNICEDM